MSFFSGLLDFGKSIAGPIIGGGLSYLGGQEQRAAQSEWNEREAQFNVASAREAMAHESREAVAARFWAADQANIHRKWGDYHAMLNKQFQERMAGTAYQRAMADMKSSGLNPILAYKQGGASTPQGSMPSAGLPGGASARGVSASIRAPQMQNLLSGAVSTAANVAKMQADVKYTNARTEQQRAETDRFKKSGDSVLGRQADTIEKMIRRAVGGKPRKYKKSGRDEVIYGRPPTSKNARRPGETRVEYLGRILKRPTKKQTQKKWGKRPGFREFGRAYRGYNPRRTRGAIY